MGSLPLFGVSYLGIILIWLWAVSVDTLNHYLGLLKELARGLVEKPVETEWLRSFLEWLISLPEVPQPEHMGYTLIALLFLAIAATVYKLFCPAQIQESSESRWVCELKHPVIVYRGLACSRLFVRWVTTFCYAIGGPWITYLLVRRVLETIDLLL